MIFFLRCVRLLKGDKLFLKKISSEYALSTGSACSAGQPSHVLKAIGLENQIGNILRISVSPEIEKEYIGNLLSLISNL